MKTEKQMERPLHKLYSLLYSLAKKQSQIYGICLLIDRLLADDIIAYDEWNKLLSHFLTQKPSLVNHKEFYCNDCYKGIYWWSNNELSIKESTQQRKLFIKRMKELTKKTKQ